MDENLIITIVATVAGLLVGVAITYFMVNKTNKGKEEAAQKQAQAILTEAEAKAEVVKNQKMMEAKVNTSKRTYYLAYPDRQYLN